MFKRSISSIELNDTNITISKVNNSSQTLEWSDIKVMGLTHIYAGNKYIRLPKYLFHDLKVNEEYLNLIEIKVYDVPTKCLECNNIITSGSMVCSSCGWSYENKNK